MARINKVGIDYYPFDVDFFNDEKIEFTSARFGVKGEVIAIRLLCKIYRNGYYTKWSDDENTLLAKRAGDNVTPSLVSDVVKELVKRGFFDESLFDRFAILTSRGIQKRYFEAVKRYNSVYVYNEYLLVDVSKMDNVHINTINVDINSNSANINSQKEIEKKINKTPPTPSKGGVSAFSFDEFWDMYDLKQGDRDKIRKKWEKLRESERLAIMDYIPKYKQSQPNKQYRKRPETFLNNKGWNDEIIENKQNANNPRLHIGEQDYGQSTI